MYLLRLRSVSKTKRSWATLDMNLVDANNKVSEIAYKCVRLQVGPDKTFSCAFQEIPEAAQNEFDALNQRKLSIEISGNLLNNEATARLAWNEIFGRPVNVNIKMILSRN